MSRREALRPQAWEWPHPRVLLEQPDSDETRARVDALRRAGYAVAVCPGPTADDRCPLAGDEGCVAARDADVVVSSLGLGMELGREPLVALRERLPDLPVLVEAAAEAASRWPDLVRPGERLEPGIAPAELVERVGLAIAEERRSRE